MAVTMITVTGTYLLETGGPASGQVDFVLSAPLQDAAAKRTYAPIVISAPLTAGAFSVALVATNDPSSAPTGLTYLVTPRIVGATTQIPPYSIVLPYTSTLGTADLSALAPVANTAVSASYVLLAAVGAPNGVASLDGTGKVPATQLPAAQIPAAPTGGTLAAIGPSTRIPAGGFRSRTLGAGTVNQQAGQTTYTTAQQDGAWSESDALPFFDFSMDATVTSGIGPVLTVSTLYYAGWLLRVVQTATALEVHSRSGATDTPVGSVTSTGKARIQIVHRIGLYTVTITVASGVSTSFDVTSESLDLLDSLPAVRLLVGNPATGIASVIVVANTRLIRNPPGALGDLRIGVSLSQPVLTTSALCDALVSRALENMRRNVLPAGTGMARPFLSAAGSSSYTGIFTWDQYWASMLLRQVGAVELARFTWLNLWDKAKTSGVDIGRIPAFLNSTGAEFATSVPSSTYSQPYHAQAALLLSHDGDVSWIGATYWSTLKAHIVYMETRLTARGLFQLFEGLESGWDEMVSTNPSQVDPGPTLRFEWIGTQCLMQREYQAMAYLAVALGVAADVTSYQGKADSLKTKIQTTAFDSAQGWFPAWDKTLNANAGGFSNHLQADPIFVLYAGLATQAQAQIVRDKLMDTTKFLGKYGVRSLTATDSFYQAVGIPAGVTSSQTNWNGPVWEPVNYLAALGLARYGFTDDALDVCARAQRGHRENLGNAAFHGTPGEWVDPDVGTPQGHSDFSGWFGMTALAETYVRSGYNPTLLAPLVAGAVVSLTSPPVPAATGTVASGATLVSDTYTAAAQTLAAGTSATSADTGQARQIFGGAFTINGTNALTTAPVLLVSKAVFYAQNQLAQSIQAAVTTTSATSAAAGTLLDLVLRSNAATMSNVLACEITTAGTIGNSLVVYKVVGGTQTNLVTATVPALGANVTHTVKFSLNNTTGAYTLAIDGTTALSGTLIAADLTMFGGATYTFAGVRTFQNGATGGYDDGNTIVDNLLTIAN